MKPMECMVVFLFIGTMATLTSAMKDDPSDLLYESRFKELQDYNRLKDLQALRSTMLLGRLIGDMDQRMEPIQKRDCYFNAGLSHSCDNEDVLSALAEARHLGSFNSPGRRRRRKRQPTMVLPLGGSKGQNEEDEERDMINMESYGSGEQTNDKGGDGKKNKYLSLKIPNSDKEEAQSGDRDPNNNHNTKLSQNVHSPTRTKRCLNLWDDSCVNGQIQSSGKDDEYLGGQESQSQERHHSSSKSKRCINLLDDGCAHDDPSDNGGNDDYFNGGDTPGKRSSPTFHHSLGESKRCLNLLDDGCAHDDPSDNGGNDDYFNGGDTPGKRSSPTFHQTSKNSIIGAGINDDDYFNGGDNPGKRSSPTFHHSLGESKRCLNLLDDGCAHDDPSDNGGNDDYFNGGDTPGKRSSPTFHQTSKNSIIGAGINDDDYFNGGDNPGKRSSPTFHHSLGESKRCLNLLDDGCAHDDPSDNGGNDDYFNGGDTPGKRSSPKIHQTSKNSIIGAGINDDDYFNGGDTPGKRFLLNNFHLFRDSLQKFHHSSSKSKRCLNLLDDGCAHDDPSDNGGNDDYFNGGDTPGKRFSPTFHHSLGESKRCINLLDDGCAHDDPSDNGGNDDYFNGGDTPGKRFSPTFHHSLGESKRCINLLDDGCAHDDPSDNGGNDDYFNGGDTPGKRSPPTFHQPPRNGVSYAHLKQPLLKSKLILYCTRFPGNGICRHLG